MKKAEKTRVAIVNTFMVLAVQNDQLPNVSEICAELDIYRSTFYNYFSGIEELRDSIGAEFIEAIDGQFEKISAYTKSVHKQGKTFEFTEALIPAAAHYMAHPDLYYVFMNPEWAYSYREYFRQKIYKACLEIQGGDSPAERYMAEFVSAGTIQYVYVQVQNRNYLEEELLEEPWKAVWKKVSLLMSQ